MNELGLPTSFGSKKQNFTRHNDYVQNNNQSTSYRVDLEVNEAFNKKFTFFADQIFDKKDICILPYPSSLFQEDKWKITEFQELKISLNNTKSKLNDLNLKEWHFHTTNINTAGDVLKKLRYSIGPEFLTQAWCKMYECLMSFWLVPKSLKNGDEFNSVHLCEAPGAFVTALNHYLQTWYWDSKWDWLATTLNPYHESNPLSHMIQDDRFILHTLDHWTFGEDSTGNLMDIDNLRHLQAYVETRLKSNVTLVTADGSIDCQINPAEQEAIVAPLHYCETLTALSILKPGGSYMLKMFTLLECDSICLMYLLVCVFESVNVFKPVKSKEGNSEVYVLCTEYIGKENLAPWLPSLYDKFGPTISKAMFSEKDIPEEFMEQMYECARKFSDLQIRVIERNLDLFHSKSSQKQFQCRMVKKRVADRYIDQYELSAVHKVIVGNDVLADTPTFNLAPKYEEGSFNDRLRNACMEKSQYTGQLWASVQDMGCQWPYQHTVCWFMFNRFRMPELKLMFGQHVLSVYSSKFCNGRILEAYNQVLTANLVTSIKTNEKINTVVDASQFPWATCSSYCHFLLLQCVTRALKDLPPSMSLCIRGLPLLTQFNVALVFLLAHSFYQLGLTVEGNVLLCGYQQASSTTQWIQSVLTDMQTLPTTKAVLSLVPINVLCDKLYRSEEGPSFYMSVTSINNARLLLSLETEVRRIEQREAQVDGPGPAHSTTT